MFLCPSPCLRQKFWPLPGGLSCRHPTACTKYVKDHSVNASTVVNDGAWFESGQAGAAEWRRLSRRLVFALSPGLPSAGSERLCLPRQLPEAHQGSDTYLLVLPPSWQQQPQQLYFSSSPAKNRPLASSHPPAAAVTDIRREAKGVQSGPRENSQSPCSDTACGLLPGAARGRPGCRRRPDGDLRQLARLHFSGRTLWPRRTS